MNVKLPKKTVFNIIILCFGAYIIYVLPYLRWTYYDALMEASGLNNTQFGITMSVFGAVSMICYPFGGFIADKFSCKKLMGISTIFAGIIGFVFATFPGYIMQCILYALWGACCTLMFWSAFIKAQRLQGTSEQQGRIFGLVEGGRGILAVLVSFIGLYFFGKLGEGLGGLRGVIIMMSSLCLVAGVLLLIFLDDSAEEKIKSDKKASLKDIGKVLKTPAVWLIAMVIVCCYCIYLGSTYLTPYFTNVIKVSVSVAAFLSIVRTYVLQFIAAPIGGFAADKVHSITKIVIACYILIVAAMMIVLTIPTGAVVLLIVSTVSLCFAIFAMRGIYFATVDEANIPMNIMGTAVGFISIIGFLPDVFMNTICGKLLDNYQGIAGYRYIFFIMLILGIIGLAVSIILLYTQKKSVKK